MHQYDRAYEPETTADSSWYEVKQETPTEHPTAILDHPLRRNEVTAATVSLSSALLVICVTMVKTVLITSIVGLAVLGTRSGA